MKISRRAFTTDALAAVAVASVVPSALAQQAPPSVPAEPAEPTSQTGPELSAAGRAEAEARINSILAKHGHRLSDEQKADVRRLVTGAQPWLESFRAYPLPNAAEPATVFRVRHSPRRPSQIESHERKAKS